jgi:predicted metal-dependent peptidase
MKHEKTIKEKQAMIDDKVTMKVYRDKLTTVKAYLSSNPNSKYLTAEVFKYNYIFVPDLPMPTFCTNGKSIMLDPEFFSQLNLKQLAFGILHETFHNILMHLAYFNNPKYNKKALNIAADAVVNSMIKVSNIGEDIPGGVNSDNMGTVRIELIDKKNKPFTLEIKECHKQNVLHVYNEIMKKAKIEDCKDHSTDGHPGDNGSADDGDTETLAENNIRRLVDGARIRGESIPGSLGSHFESLIKPKINLARWLKQNMFGNCHSHYSYNKPNRRSESTGIILPTSVKQSYNMIAAIDTSGSISEPEARHAIGLLYNTMREKRDSIKMRLLLHTSAVYYNEMITKKEQLEKLKITSGGTSHDEVFEIAEKNWRKGDILICITDGETSFPKTNIKNVLWVIVNNDRITPPYGKTIHVKHKDIGGE